MQETASLVIGIAATLILTARIGQYLGDWLAHRVHARKMEARAVQEGMAAEPTPASTSASGKGEGVVGKDKSA